MVTDKYDMLLIRIQDMLKLHISSCNKEQITNLSNSFLMKIRAMDDFLYSITGSIPFSISDGENYYKVIIEIESFKSERRYYILGIEKIQN